MSSQQPSKTINDYCHGSLHSYPNHLSRPEDQQIKNGSYQIWTEPSHEPVVSESIWPIYFTLNPAGVILSVDGQRTACLGYSFEELIGKSIFSLFHLQDQARLYTELAAVWSQAFPSRPSKFCLVYKDGRCVDTQIVPRILQTLEDTALILLRCENAADEEQTPGVKPSLWVSKDAALANSEQFLLSIYNSIEASIFVVDVLEDGNFQYVALNTAHDRWKEIKPDDVVGKTPQQIFSPSDAAVVRQHYSNCVRSDTKISYEECLRSDGLASWWLTTLTPLRDAKRIYRLIGTSTNITRLKQTEEALRRQTEREKLVAKIAQRIRESLDLNTILYRTVEEVQQFLQTDRVLIYRFLPDWSGAIAVESVAAPWPAILGSNFKDPCFTAKYIESYRQGWAQVIDDIYTTDLNQCHIDLLASLQVRANLVVPVLSEQKLWGLLIAQHCREPRQWQQTEIDLLKQLATQVGIAVQQAELHHQLQSLNTHLEFQVKERTFKLQQAVNFSESVQRFTEKVRDSLDESQILHSATQEVAQALQVNRSKVELYNSSHTTATIAYEYTTELPLCQGSTRRIEDFPELYHQLLQKQPLQFIERVPTWNPKVEDVTRLACPIFDDQGILGNLWLLKPRDEMFDEFEIQLVQQVANQCAIAIRQARLYETAQSQVRELEKLICLKNEFLQGITHELRTPMSSITLAIQTLDKILAQHGVIDRENVTVTRTLRILQSECQREIRLINNLLTISYAAGGEILAPVVINLHDWIPKVLEPFQEYTSNRQQNLEVAIADELPPLKTDLSYLERIFNELLHNAYKYTPAEGTILVSVYTTAETLELSVTNSGVEIAPAEITRIFDKFYRIPNSDVWECGGAGLGLAVVKQLAERLGASIQLQSTPGQTTFILQFTQGVSF